MDPSFLSEDRRQAARKIFIVACCIHLFIVLLLSLGPETGDHPRYRIQAQTVLAGKNIYAHYSYYNYGPPWMYIVSVAYGISAAYMRTVLALMLGLSACLAAIPVKKLYGFRVAILFLLSPLTLLLTGWFCMFDIMSFGLALAALAYAAKHQGFQRPGLSGLSLKQVTVVAALLGASLLVKHNLIFFLGWLFVSTPGWRKKAVIVGLPIAVFLFSFVPYLPEGWEGIKDNVFAYKGMFNVPWLQLIVPLEVFDKLTQTEAVKPYIKILFFGSLLVSGWLLRKKSLRESFLWHTAFLLLFSPTLHVYYTFIPLLFLLHAPKRGYLLFTGSLLLFIALYHVGGQGGLGGRALLGNGFWGKTADWYVEYWSSIAVYLLGFTLWDAARTRKIQSSLYPEAKEAFRAGQ